MLFIFKLLSNVDAFFHHRIELLQMHGSRTQTPSNLPNDYNTGVNMMSVGNFVLAGTGLANIVSASKVISRDL